MMDFGVLKSFQLLVPAAMAASGVLAYCVPELAASCAVASCAFALSAFWSGNRTRQGDVSPVNAFATRISDLSPFEFSVGDLRSHLLVMGDEKSGRFEVLLRVAEMALVSGSGLLFVDASGPDGALARISNVVRQSGRGEDLLVLDLRDAARPSHSIPVLVSRDPDDAAALLVDACSWDGAAESKSRALLLAKGVLRSLFALRNQGALVVDPAVVQAHLDLSKLAALTDKVVYPSLPGSARNAVLAYFASLPGYDGVKGAQQSPAVRDTHRAVQRSLSEALQAILSRPEAFVDAEGDIDLFDIVRNRRVLVVLLPRCPEDPIASPLGRIVMAGMRQTVQSLPEDGASKPFVAVLDGVGHYVNDSFDALAASAKSKDVCLVYGAHVASALRQRDGRLRSALTTDVGAKMLLGIEDPETANLAIDLGGRSYGLGRQGRRDLVRFSDLKAQAPGEMHFARAGKVERVAIPIAAAGNGSESATPSVEAFLAPAYE